MCAQLSLSPLTVSGNCDLSIKPLCKLLVLHHRGFACTSLKSLSGAKTFQWCFAIEDFGFASFVLCCVCVHVCACIVCSCAVHICDYTCVQVYVCALRGSIAKWSRNYQPGNQKKVPGSILGVALLFPRNFTHIVPVYQAS